jgi:hypothetical protein
MIKVILRPLDQPASCLISSHEGIAWLVHRTRLSRERAVTEQVSRLCANVRGGGEKKKYVLINPSSHRKEVYVSDEQSFEECGLDNLEFGLLL